MRVVQKIAGWHEMNGSERIRGDMEHWDNYSCEECDWISFTPPVDLPSEIYSEYEHLFYTEISRESMLDGKTYTMRIPVSQERVDAYWKAIHPPLIKEAFPDLLPEYREFIKTGITPEVWDKTFRPDDEE